MNINEGFAKMQIHFRIDTEYIDIDNTDITF